MQHDRSFYHQKIMRILTQNQIASMTVMACYGFNFLLFASRSSVVAYGGILANPHIWAAAFLGTAIVMGLGLLRQDIMWLYQIAQGLLMMTLTTWIVIRVIIVFQTGNDPFSPILFCYMLYHVIQRLRSAREAGDAFAVQSFNSLDDIWRHWTGQCKRKRVE